jgi:hypothetical protein
VVVGLLRPTTVVVERRRERERERERERKREEEQERRKKGRKEDDGQMRLKSDGLERE